MSFKIPFSDWREGVRDRLGDLRERFGWLRLWLLHIPHAPPRARWLLTGLAAFGVWNAFILFTDGWVPTKAPPAVKETEARAAVPLALGRAIAAEQANGWMPNDTIFWPTYWLFNYQNFQMGELEVWYRVSIELRDHLSRVRKTDDINPHLSAASRALSNDPTKWWFPSFESRLDIAQTELDAYARERLADPAADDTLERADNLRHLVEDLASVLGGMQDRLLQTLPASAQPLAKVSVMPVASDQMSYIGPFYAAGVFYHAKGEAYAALVTLEAVRIEYARVLERKQATGLVDDAIFLLREAIGMRPLLVLNSGRDSIFANHPNNFAAPFSLARAKVNSLIDVLKNG